MGRRSLYWAILVIALFVLHHEETKKNLLVIPLCLGALVVGFLFAALAALGSLAGCLYGLKIQDG